MKNTGVFDYCIWVDRSDHVLPEPRDSMNLEIWMADHVIDNNSTLEVLHRSVGELVDHLLIQQELSNIGY
jgi:hypothetical protein